MPAPDLLREVPEQTPDGFTFVLKAPQRITHHRRLADVGDALSYFFETGGRLGRKRGPSSSTLPPYMKKDAGAARGVPGRCLPAAPRRLRVPRTPPGSTSEVRQASCATRGARALPGRHATRPSEPPPSDSSHRRAGGYLRLRRVELRRGGRARPGPTACSAQPWDRRLRLLQARGRERAGPDVRRLFAAGAVQRAADRRDR